MKTIIRLTESDLHRIISTSVRNILKEGAFDKYKKDIDRIELDTVQPDLGMAYAYSHMNDPMVRKVTGSTVGDLLKKDTFGNESGDMGFDSEDPSAIRKNEKESEEQTNKWLNTPNASRNFKLFPRSSRTNGGVKDYNSLRNGSEKIRNYRDNMGKKRMGAV